MDNSLRTQKELIKMREAALSNWRKDLNEEHPYVEVMPAPGMEREDKKKVLKKGIEAKKEQGMKGQMKEGYKKQSERKHDDMNDAAHKHDRKLRKKLNPELSDDELTDGKFSSKGNTITQEIEDNRQDPTEYKKERKAKEIENRANGYRKRMKESKDIDKIAKELDGAVEMHADQAKRLRKHSKDMKEEKNCGCGKDPCITYGKKEKK